jgi:HSP20 family protein
MANLPAIYRLFDDLFSAQGLPMLEGRFNPPVEVDETDSHYVLSFDLPGMKKEDIQLNVQEGVLTLHAERKGRVKEKGHRSEKFYGVIERSISLPSNIKSEAVEAQLEDGVLHVAIPKAESAQPKQIAVSESKGGFLTKLLGSEKKKVA